MARGEDAEGHGESSGGEGRRPTYYYCYNAPIFTMTTIFSLSLSLSLFLGCYVTTTSTARGDGFLTFH